MDVRVIFTKVNIGYTLKIKEKDKKTPTPPPLTKGHIGNSYYLTKPCRP